MAKRKSKKVIRRKRKPTTKKRKKAIKPRKKSNRKKRKTVSKRKPTKQSTISFIKKLLKIKTNEGLFKFFDDNKAKILKFRKADPNLN